MHKIPRTGALRGLLERLRVDRSPGPGDRICLHESAKKCLETACRRLGFPKFTHHDFRHFFATTCIESGVDTLRAVFQEAPYSECSTSPSSAADPRKPGAGEAAVGSAQEEAVRKAGLAESGAPGRVRT